MRLSSILILLTLLVCALIFAAERPTLVLVISVDQMRPDYFERFGDDFTGAFKKLYTEGIVYTEARLNYAVSETAPGYATLSTGSYPRTHGIHRNDGFDRATRTKVYSVQDLEVKPVEGEGGGKSPRRLLVPAIGDWLKASSPASKVISISRKDRAAVLMGGKRPDLVFWYSHQSGHMVTSDYYVQTLPPWVRSFNRSNWIERNVPAAWTKLMAEDVYSQHGPDEFRAEYSWSQSTRFPHTFDPARKTEQIATSPYIDLLMLDFAAEAIHSEQLGRRNVTDILWIGLSATDDIGHSFGPNSHEIQDHLLRVDLALGDFLEKVEGMVGRENLLVVLTADHGVLPLPEFLTEFTDIKARRINFDEMIRPHVHKLEKRLQKEFGIDENLFEHFAFLNYAAADRAGVDSTTLDQRVREGLLAIDGIEDVYFRRELLNSQTPDRPYLELYRRSYSLERGEDFRVRYCEYCLISSHSTGTTHGSPYSYDTHIPLVFWRSDIQPRRVVRRVSLVDVAPTLVRILELKYPDTVDGRVLNEVVREP